MTEIINIIRRDFEIRDHKEYLEKALKAFDLDGVTNLALSFFDNYNKKSPVFRYFGIDRKVVEFDAYNINIRTTDMFTPVSIHWANDSPFSFKNASGALWIGLREEFIGLQKFSYLQDRVLNRLDSKTEKDNRGVAWTYFCFGNENDIKDLLT